MSEKKEDCTCGCCCCCGDSKSKVVEKLEEIVELLKSQK